jgi:hypothetical protein
MPKNRQDSSDRTVELLEKLLAFQLHALGVGQSRIATAVGKGKTWVNDLLRDVPKGGRS